MRTVVTVMMTSLLLLAASSFGSALADNANADNLEPYNDTLLRNSYELMFEGVNLTEEQRQQMRDLMHQARRNLPRLDVNEADVMYKLVTAQDFDEIAVKALAEKMAQERISQQVEMAKIRNQMYSLLSDKQKIVLEQKHQQRMQRMQQLLKIQQIQQQNLSQQNGLQSLSVQGSGVTNSQN